MARKTKQFIAALGSLGAVGYLIYELLTSQFLTEAQRYFGITLVLLMLMVIYTETVVTRK